MHILILSDLHLEFASVDLPESKVDVVILAGDVHIGTRGISWIAERFRDVPTIYVLGNHAYYGGTFQKVPRKIKTATESSCIHILENRSLVVDDVVFLGTTLWTDFDLSDNRVTAAHEAERRMSDYRKIRMLPGYRRLRTADVVRLNAEAVGWLKRGLSQCRGQKAIVVSHHAPSRRSLPASFAEDPVSPAYASDQEDLIEEYQPQLWVRGHLHQSCDYMIGGTRVICNPRGYGAENTDGFDPVFVVEL